MQLFNSTYLHQYRFANFCRTGAFIPIEGVNKERAQHYRELVYNAVDDSLQSAFPLTFDLLGSEKWDPLVNEFFSEHNYQTPQLWKLPKELYDFILASKHPLLSEYPFLAELLWFEWLEIELFMMEDKKAEFIDKGNLSSDQIIINPEHHLQYFSFPVHIKIAEKITFNDKAHYFLCAHRDPGSGKVLFTQLSPLLARMLEILGQQAMSIDELLSCFENNEKIKKGTLLFFENALKSKLILGFKE
ncbi:MAG: DUF2063 domain-containing protein [Flavobacteriales bacterium]